MTSNLNNNADLIEDPDTARLAALGYKQRLTRSMGLWSNFAIGFTYLSPVVGVYALFAVGLSAVGPAMFWTIPIVLTGQFLVALVFAEVSSEFPLAGGIYQWTKRLVGGRFAWLAGWMYTWALLITVASVAFSANLYAAPLFGYTTNTLNNILVPGAIIIFGGVINLLGVRRLAIVARIGVVAELGGSVVIALILLFRGRHHGLDVLLQSPNTFLTQPSDAHIGVAGAFLAAMLFSIWIFYGFEACGDIAEEVINPSQMVPRAMRYTLYVGGAASTLITVALILATPDFGAVLRGTDADPVTTIFTQTLGATGSKFALAMILLAFISCGLAIQAAAIRLVYSFARDGVLVGARTLSKVHPKLHMPPFAVLIAVVIPLFVLFMPSASVTRIITFAVIGIYIGFQSVVLAALIARSRGWKPAGAFRLGSYGWVVNILAFVYGVTAIIILSVKTPAMGASFLDKWLVPVSAGTVLALGIIYLLIFRPKESIGHEDRA